MSPTWFHVDVISALIQANAIPETCHTCRCCLFDCYPFWRWNYNLYDKCRKKRRIVELYVWLDWANSNYRFCCFLLVWDGWTVLIWASCEGYLSVVNVLLAAGADSHQSSRWGKVPYSHSCRCCSSWVIVWGAITISDRDVQTELNSITYSG